MIYRCYKNNKTNISDISIDNNEDFQHKNNLKNKFCTQKPQIFWYSCPDNMRYCKCIMVVKNISLKKATG